MCIQGESRETADSALVHFDRNQGDLAPLSQNECQAIMSFLENVNVKEVNFKD